MNKIEMELLSVNIPRNLKERMAEYIEKKKTEVWPQSFTYRVLVTEALEEYLKNHR